MFNDGLDRGETGAAGDQQHWLFGILAQVETTMRTIETHHVAFFQLIEYVLGKLPARNMPDMQLQTRIVVRRIGQREGATAAFLEQNFDVLPCEVLQALIRRQLEFDDHHVGRGARQLLYACRKSLGRYLLRRAQFTALNEQIAARLGATEQRTASQPIGLTQRIPLCSAVIEPLYLNTSWYTSSEIFGINARTRWSFRFINGMM